MRKTIVAIVTAIILALSSCSITFGAETRTETGVIITANIINNYWEVLDVNGDIWYFTSGEDLERGDLVRIRFDTANTSFIYDDKIIKVFCIGYVDNIDDFLKE